MAPAVRVAVRDGFADHEAPAFAQFLNDGGADFPDVLRAKERQLLGVAAAAAHGVEHFVQRHAMRHAGVEVVHAVGGRGVHDAGAVAVADVFGQMQRREAPVAVGAGGRVQVVEGMAEGKARQLFAAHRGEHAALQPVAFQRLRHQLGAQQQHAARRVHKGVVQRRVRVQRLVCGNGPRRRRPDDGKRLLALRQFFHTKRGGKRSRVVRLKRHVQRRALFVGVFNLGFRQRRAAVKAPVDGFQPAVHVAALHQAAKQAQLARFAGMVHRQVWVLPVAEHAQTLEIGHLRGDLFGGVGAPPGLHFVARKPAPKLLFNLVFNGQAVAVPAGHVMRVQPF